MREKWYYHDTESGQEMMTGPASTDAPIMRLIDRNGDGSFADADEEQHFVNDHQGSTVLVTGKAVLDATTGELVSRGPIIAHVKYDQYGVPKFVHPADVNSDGVVDASDVTFWKQAWNEYKAHNTSSTPSTDVWRGVADADESGVVDESSDGVDPTLPSATNTDWLAFSAQYTAATVGSPPTLAEQLGNLPLYAGYWWDDAVGVYHVRHRVYRPEWGRWLQRDPLGYAPGWNLYQYVNGMPWNAVDPMGLWSVKEILYTIGLFPIEVVKQTVTVVDAIMHPIRTGEAIGDRAVQIENNVAIYENYAPTTLDYTFSVFAEFIGANQMFGGWHGVNIAEERITTGWERFEDITVGTSAVASSFIGYSTLGVSTVRMGASVASRTANLLNKGNAPPLCSPGPFAKQSIPASSTAQTFTEAERAVVNSLGKKYGCHSCGTNSPGTKSGNWVPDHQQPTAIWDGKGTQRLFPQCIHCSRMQGLELIKYKRGLAQ